MEDELETHTHAKVYGARNWEEIQTLLESKFCGAQWVFRGQRDANWPLQTSLERVCNNLDKSKWRRAEEHLLLQFQRRLHQYEKVIPDVDDHLEWFSLMQHHGAPTRLLDWTRSPFVAVHFAVEAATRDRPSALWALNRQVIHNDNLEQLPELLPAIMTSAAQALSHKSVFSKFFLHGKKPSVVAVEPFRMNERLTVQQGLFLWPSVVEESFSDNLAQQRLKMVDTTPYLFKINMALSADNRIKTLEELQKMNISRASLFPGLDGFAQSLATEIEIWGSFSLERIMYEGYFKEYF